MLMGRLLASACALGLLAAAPAFAADATTGDATSTGTPATTASPGAQNNAAGTTSNPGNVQGANGSTATDNTNAAPSKSASTRMSGGKHMAQSGSHHWSHHAMRSSRSGQTDASQNSAVDRLNQQSLQAAQEGHSFDMGSAGNSSGSMGGSSGMGSGAMSPGSGSGTMGTHGSGSTPSGGPSSGTSHL